MPCVGPKSGMGGKYLSHGLKAVAMQKSKDALKENPAFKWVKMQAVKSPVLKKHAKDTAKGKASNLPKAKNSAYMSEMKDMGKE